MTGNEDIFNSLTELEGKTDGQKQGMIPSGMVMDEMIAKANIAS